jgi:hypothetical protein
MLLNTINGRITDGLDKGLHPDLQNVHQWLAANRDSSVYVDAYDEEKGKAMNDIIINFNVDGTTKYQMRLPNTYGAARDVNLTRAIGVMPDLTAILETVNLTKRGVTR